MRPRRDVRPDAGPFIDEDGLGSLLEISRGGQQPVDLPSGETRSFLEDGDEITLRAWCERGGAVRIGLGECVGRVVPAAG